MRTCQRPKVIPKTMEQVKKAEFNDNVKKVLENMRREWKSDPEGFEKKLKEHENGDFAIMLRESGAIRLLMEDIRKKGGQK